MNLENVSRDDWIVGGLALLLDHRFSRLPWFSTRGRIRGGRLDPVVRFHRDRRAGRLARSARRDRRSCVVADLAVERLSPQTQVPRSVAAARTRGSCSPRQRRSSSRSSSCSTSTSATSAGASSLRDRDRCARVLRTAGAHRGGSVRTSARPATPAGTPPPASRAARRRAPRAHRRPVRPGARASRRRHRHRPAPGPEPLDQTVI